jgi:hypothetical protein
MSPQNERKCLACQTVSLFSEARLVKVVNKTSKGTSMLGQQVYQGQPPLDLISKLLVISGCYFCHSMRCRSAGVRLRVDFEIQ